MARVTAVPDIQAAVIQRTLLVPVPVPVPGSGPVASPGRTPGPGEPAARQLDVALMAVGFKCSPELLARLSTLDAEAVAQIGRGALAAVRRLVGDHVQHNVYFKDFPAHVPDTREFWAQCVGDALIDHRSRDSVRQGLVRGVINLLDLPEYGRYQHTFER